MTSAQAARYLGLHQNTIGRVSERWGIPHYRFGSGNRVDRRFRRSELDEWLAARKVP